MKIPLLLLILCSAALLNGCSTNGDRGATTDPYSSSTGSLHQAGPVIADPSIPLDANTGPQMPPP